MYSLNRKTLKLSYRFWDNGEIIGESEYSCSINDKGRNLEVIEDLATKAKNKLEEGNLL